MNARALAEITSHKPQNFSVFSRNLYALEVHGNFQLDCFMIGNGKCKQHSDWSELELSTADRVIPTRETK